MRVLFTGASSAIGSRVLEEILKSDRYLEIWCARHKRDLNLSDPRLRVVELDLSSTDGWEELPASIDLVLHFAAATHARDAARYWKVNHEGTMRLAVAAQARGCRRFVFVSTRCATAGAGEYGESKLAAEDGLKKIDWQSLLIIRPAEIYGAGGNEGIDRLIWLSRRWHIAPMLFGNSRIGFAPLHVDDFTAVVARAIAKAEDGHSVMEVCGPEDLSGPALAGRLARHFKAVPVPVWWPVLALLVKSGLMLGVPDQVQRLTCRKTAAAKTANAIGKIRFFAD